MPFGFVPRWQPWATAGRCELGPRNYFRVIDHEKMAFFLLLLLLLILCVCVCARWRARTHKSSCSPSTLRYKLPGLNRLVSRVAFTVLRISSFCSLPFPSLVSSLPPCFPHTASCLSSLRPHFLRHHFHVRASEASWTSFDTVGWEFDNAEPA